MATVILNNRYRILRELGQGGFGKTFLAVDTHLPSKQHCVIKQLYPIISKPQQYQWVRERFQREAAILESLSRSNSQIPQLYAYFAEGETFYLVQEYIEGVTLTEKVKQNGPLSEYEVTSILESLLQVLDYVHQNQIIHRDVKADNIILRASDQKPVLIDFGVVKEALGTAINSEQTYSMAIGTPGYMPSEQAAGRPLFSSDLYSLGLTAIFLLSGQSPHLLESDPNSGELLWRKVVPNLNGQLAKVIDGAVCCHPRDRFANAKDMLAALTSTTSTANQHSDQHLPSQSQLGERATVAAVSPHEDDEQFASQQGNPILQGLFIILLLLGSAGVLGFGVIQVLDSLRQGRDVVKEETEQTNPDSEQNPTSTPQQQTNNEETNPEETNPDREQNPTSTPQQQTSNEETNPEETNPDREQNPTSTPQQQSNNEETNPDSELNLEEVPVLTPGTSQKEVIDTLGKPTSKKNGYWENTQSFLYKDYVPEKLNLGYLFDRDTKKLRQTEMSFDSSVALNVIEQKLEQMLEGKMDSKIREALEAVYRKETDLRSFSVGNLSGMIQRQRGSKIYIGVWEDNLHENQ